MFSFIFPLLIEKKVDGSFASQSSNYAQNKIKLGWKYRHTKKAVTSYSVCWYRIVARGAFLYKCSLADSAFVSIKKPKNSCYLISFHIIHSICCSKELL